MNKQKNDKPKGKRMKGESRTLPKNIKYHTQMKKNADSRRKCAPRARRHH